MKAAVNRQAQTVKPGPACHRATGEPETKPQCGIKSRCGNDHAETRWNPEPPYLPGVSSELPPPVMLVLQPIPLPVDWPSLLLSPSSPPPQASIAG